MLISLKKIYEEDQKDRNESDWDDEQEVKNINERDRLRRAQVDNILKHHKSLSAVDYYYASLIFQHGDKPDDYRRANELAQKSMKMGEEKAKWMYAATMDRWLLSIKKPQKYGTQFIQQKGENWELAQPIDETITDVEREKYNVPPLSKALKIYNNK